MSRLPSKRFLLLVRSTYSLVAVLSITSLFGLVPDRVWAQSASAALKGTVVDSTGAVLGGATVTAIHEATGSRREVHSASDGSFTISTLAPGRYVVLGARSGFRPSELRGVVLNVDDRLVVRLELAIAGVDESVTVNVEGRRINTAPGVSTVIDRTFVENLPLNGRSFQALLQLTPGVVLNPGSSGQFSVNGQRATSNYITVDGVSATAGTFNTGTSGTLGPVAGGQVPAFTAVGGTTGLVSVDALQEFRIQTSGFAPEFGRMPGGQVSLVTRSGTNNLHGSAFEYFRDDAFDASDWFLNRSGLPGTELRQHNFGGVLGGPIVRNKLFAFGSYERLDLLIPRVRTAAVPTVATRSAAASVFRPYLDALPLPNSRDLGNGFADFVAAYSEPSRVDSTSIRVDYNWGSRVKLFGRISDAPSSTETRGQSYGHASVSETNSRGGTFGSTWVISGRAVHDVRMNITDGAAPFSSRQMPIGGAVPFSPLVLPSGRDPASTSLALFVTGGGVIQWGPFSSATSRQVNVVDSLVVTTRSHEFKFGIDYRRTNAITTGQIGGESMTTDLAGLLAGRLSLLNLTFSDIKDRTIGFDNLSLYAQDHWRVAPRLTLSYGVRWELVPPPEVGGVPAVTLERTSSLFDGQVGLDEPGTSLWKIRYNNFAPRVGASYLLSDDSRWSLLLKGGFGTFYDLGYGSIGNAVGSAYPYTFTRGLSNVTLPLDQSLVGTPVFGVAPPSSLTIMDRNLELPYTLQWNLTAEQGLGTDQTLTIGYVGASGRDLLRSADYRLSLREWPTSTTRVTMFRNQGHSDYHALQLQFNRRLRKGLQSILSYTFGRSRDTESAANTSVIPIENSAPGMDYGYSSFDIRHVLNAAVTYQLPQPSGARLWRALASEWGVDVVFRAHSGYPVDVQSTVVIPPTSYFLRPNVVPGQPFWVDDPSAPGGRKLNRQAFSTPVGVQGNLPRGAVRGFNLAQVDLALRREISMIDRLRLQLRVEAFNVLNTPHFGDPAGRIESANFGPASQMHGAFLGGQNVLYQIGGPRSIQFSTKVLF